MPIDVRTLFEPILIAATVLLAVAVIVGVSRVQQRRAAARDRAYATSVRLAAALDRIGTGIVLLDADTRAEFINRAFRTMFALPDTLADSKPPFIALMYHGRDIRIYALPDDELDGFIARRTELIRAGDPMPFDIRLADGQVVRLTCAPLPDGGRMLSYSPITDLIRHDDDPARTGYYQSLRGSGDVFAGGQMSAAE